MKSPFIKKIARISVVLIATILLLEVALQVLSLAAFLLFAPEEESIAADHEGRIAYCVGDSFTFGYGSSDAGTKSYPARLESRLRSETGEDWTVINLGYPGFNTEQMAKSLASRITAFPPDLVVVVGGVNDFWSGPATVGDLVATGDPGEKSFRWEFRTGKLLKTLRQHNPFRSKAAPAESPPAPTIAEETERKAVTENSSFREIWEFAKDGSFEEAMELFRNSRATPDEIASGLAYCYTRMGDEYREELEAQLDVLRESVARDPRADNVFHLLHSISLAHRNEELLAMTAEEVVRFPGSFGIGMLRSHALLLSDQTEAARVELKRVDGLDMQSVDDPELKVWFWHNQMTAFREHPGLEADLEQQFFAAIKSSQAYDGEKPDNDLQALRGIQGTDEEFSAALARASVSPELESQLKGLLLKSREPQDTTTNPFEIAGVNHLSMAKLAREHGATVLFSSYPFTAADHAEVIKAASKEAKVYYLRIDDDFQERTLPELGRSQYFITDGHCNDAGYDLMAELITEKVLAILPSTED